jgi:hypothetical protein
MKTDKSHSWVVYMEKLLKKYNLPEISSIYEHSPSKREWKQVVRDAIYSHWEEVLEEEAKCRSTLQFLNKSPSFTKTHPCISYLNSLRKAQRAVSKMKILTGTYTLQTVRLVYKQTYSPICLLCNKDEETVTHFILECCVLTPVRDPLIKKLAKCIPYVYEARDAILSDPAKLTQVILDPTVPDVHDILPLQSQVLKNLEDISQSLIYALHLKRASILADLQG